MSVYLFNSKGYSDIQTKTFGDITPLTPAPRTPVNKAFSCMFVLAGCWIIRAVLSRALFQLVDVQMRFMLDIARSRPRLGQYFFDIEKGCMHFHIKVIFGFGAFVIYIGAGAPALYHLQELDLVDSLYVSGISLATTGYGNPEFKTLSGRLFASFCLLVSTWAVTSIILFFTEAMTVKDLFTAYNFRNGFFRVYKLIKWRKYQRRVGDF